jgi:hypothetical protein
MMRRVLDALPGTGKFVLNGTDRPFGDHSGAKGKVTPAIRPWTLHDLRRSFASGLQRLAVAPHVVELALNHRSGTFSGVAGIYQRHRYAKEVQEAFELWSRHVEAITIKKAVHLLIWSSLPSPSQGRLTERANATNCWLNWSAASCCTQ